MFARGAYLLWAFLGKLLTGHSGLFFLDPELIGNVKEAIVAAGFAFVTLSPGSKLIIPNYLIGRDC
jgi:hypothetical protein